MSVAGKIISIKKNGSLCKNQPSVLPDTYRFTCSVAALFEKKAAAFLFFLHRDYGYCASPTGGSTDG